MFKRINKNQSGQSVLEILLALAVFAMFAAAMVSLILGSFDATRRGGEELAAATFADEGVEATRAVRDRAWNELTLNQTGATSTTGAWQLTSEGASDSRDEFNRQLNFSNVCRDVLGAIVTCPAGTPDLHSRQLSSVVTWPRPLSGTNEVRRDTLLTNWDSRDWVTTDWTGQTGTNVDVSTAGELKLAGQPLAWSTATSPVSQTLTSVSCRTANDCWAVGNAITTGPSGLRGELIIHWDGISWSRVGPLAAVPDVNLNSVFCIAASDCWAVGNASGGELIIRWNGSSWSRVGPGTAPDVNLNSVFCLTTANCWAVGNTSGGEVTIQWNGASWSRIGPASAPDVNLNTIFCLATNNCWAAGASGTIISWNGSSWSLSQDTGGQSWQSLWFFSPTDGLVAGSGNPIRRWNGINWNTSLPTGTPQSKNELHCLSASYCWVTAANGLLISWNGANWTIYPSSPTNQNLNSIFLTAPNAGFAVGAGGVILVLAGGGYETSGELISLALDLNDSSPIQIIDWDERIPTCTPNCAAKLQLRAAATAPALGSAPWSADFTNHAGTIIPVSYNGNRFVQYRVLFAGDGNDTPVVEEVRINYK
ncbi:MAG: hypothetical protein AAB455_00895 [Patescibacteria group bacterium]